MAHIKARLTHGGRLLEITRGAITKPATYSVERTPKGFVLTKEGGESYECCVDGFGPYCDCAAALFRPHTECRHITALRKVGLIDDKKKQSIPDV